MHSRLRVDLPTIPYPATVLDALRIVMSPVHEPSKLVPLVHTTHFDAIADAKRHAFGQIEIMRDQQRPAVTDIDDESLVTRAVIVVMQEAADEAFYFGPPPIIAFPETDAFSSRSAAPL